tara:strand:- start:455 stop:592 length:138 start_codon:yes stop_codon:yes gene_type:complete
MKGIKIAPAIIGVKFGGWGINLLIAIIKQKNIKVLIISLFNLKAF